MRFERTEVQRLLSEQLEQLETLWDQDPYNEVNAIALTIKEFMGDNQISGVEQGIQRFIDFKREQSRRLAAVGLANDGDFTGRLPSSRRLEPQVA